MADAAPTPWSFRAARWALLVMALAAVAWIALVPPGVATTPPCPFHAMTGLRCPGCGTLRALHALAQSDVAGAFSLNAMTTLGLPLLALSLLFWRRLSTAVAARPKAMQVAMIAFFVGTLLVWGWRIVVDVTIGHPCDTACPNALATDPGRGV